MIGRGCFSCKNHARDPLFIVRRGAGGKALAGTE